MVENFSTDREKKVSWRSSHSNVSTCCGIETMTWGFLRGKLLCLCYKWRRKVHYTRKLFRWTLSIGLCMTGMEGHKINKNNYFFAFEGDRTRGNSWLLPLEWCVWSPSPFLSFITYLLIFCPSHCHTTHFCLRFNKV